MKAHVLAVQGFEHVEILRVFKDEQEATEVCEKCNNIALAKHVHMETPHREFVSSAVIGVFILSCDTMPCRFFIESVDLV